MAVHFHTPHPPRRPRRPGAPALTLVPALLAPVLPMPRPAIRPVRLVLLSCPCCQLAADPMPAAEAEQLAGTHDDLHHAGRPTATLHTVHTLTPGRAPRTSVDGPDFGGAA